MHKRGDAKTAQGGLCASTAAVGRAGRGRALLKYQIQQNSWAGVAAPPAGDAELQVTLGMVGCCWFPVAVNLFCLQALACSLGLAASCLVDLKRRPCSIRLLLVKSPVERFE